MTTSVELYQTGQITMEKRSWMITGYAGLEPFFERILDSQLSEAEVGEILKRLACRHLNADEVISASLRTNALARTSHLEVMRNTGGNFALGTTGNPHYTATVISK